jgi:hypothetical protein
VNGNNIMKCIKAIVVGVLFGGLVTLHGMDRQQILILPDCKNFDDLIQNNAAFLKSLVAREQSGKYDSDLHEAMLALRNNSELIFEKGKLESRCDSETVRFVKLMTSRDNDLKLLIQALKRFNYEDARIICKTNPYVVNAYSLYPEYGGIASPLHYALWYYSHTSEAFLSYIDKNIHYLLKFGANVNARDYANDTPLHNACTQQRIEQLWLNGAKTNKKNKSGLTPLMQFIKREKYDLALFLIVNRADIHVRDSVGDTVLHYAVREQECALVECLLSSGADFDIENKSGETAADCAPHSSTSVKQLMERHMVSHFCQLLLDDKCIAIKFFIDKYPWLNYADILIWAKKNCFNKMFDGTLESLRSVSVFEEYLK